MPNTRTTIGLALLHVGSLTLIAAGVFAIALASTGRFLPHDEHFLGMTAGDLCDLHACRIVHFMIHDRVAFGGTLIAIGTVYHWLIAVPLRRSQAWAWRTLVASACVGFASFFAYLGYGYLDIWHGIATLFILPCFVIGLAMTHVRGSLEQRRPRTFARVLLMGTTIGLIVAGLTIATIGMTFVFVREDLNYLGLERSEVAAVHPRLVPLIAHDRAGFGGAVASFGVAASGCVWFGRSSKWLWRNLGIAGFAAFGSAIGVHPAIGYVDGVHLAPAVFGAFTYFAGIWLCSREAEIE